MFKELEIVELTHDIKNYNLKKGARGTIVEIYKNGKAYEVEFISLDEKTSTLIVLKPNDIRSTTNKDTYEYISTAPFITFRLHSENFIKDFADFRIKIEPAKSKGFLENYHYQ